MSEHHATIGWNRPSAEFTKGKYSREHEWVFDGGATVSASPSPSVVPAPYSNPAYVDPEEAFVAAVASCHMLSFLYVASRSGFVVDRYDDDAVGRMSKNDKGIPWVSQVILRPRIVYGGGREPTPDESRRLHHDAHEQCFIANSIKTEVEVEERAAESAAGSARDR
jgi:organic hydroperoxide reductase OsmC/OhrA